jgi:HEAT repeat protein
MAANARPNRGVISYEDGLNPRLSADVGKAHMRASTAVLLVASWISGARADEPTVFAGKTVEEWTTQLDQASARGGGGYEDIAWALGHFGPRAEAAVPRLAELFVKEGCEHLTGAGAIGFLTDVRDALVRIGDPAVPALLQILNGPDEDMRVCAADALGRIGPEAKAAVPSLIRIMERVNPAGPFVVQGEPTDGTPLLIRTVIRALGAIGPDARTAAPVLATWLGRDDDTDWDVIVALDRIGAPPVVLLRDRFLRGADSPSALELAYIGPKTVAIAPDLVGVLDHPGAQTRIDAAVALSFIDPSNPDVVPVLIDGLGHLQDKQLNTILVVRALAHLGPAARAALPNLMGLLKQVEADPEIIRAFVRIDPQGETCVPWLIESLRGDDPDTVLAAIDALGLLGPRARDALPALITAIGRDLTNNQGRSSQAEAIYALGRIDPTAPSVLSALLDVLKSPRGVRGDESEDYGHDIEAAADVLATLGPSAASAIPPLMNLLRHRRQNHYTINVFDAIALALGQIGPEAKEAIPILKEIAAEAGPISASAVAALYRLAPDGADIAKRWLNDPARALDFPGLQRLQIESEALVLGTIGRAGPELDALARGYVAHLDKSLEDRFPWDTQEAEFIEWQFKRLSRLGAAARVAVPRLKEYLDDPDPWVRLWAKEALQRIGEEPMAKTN